VWSYAEALEWLYARQALGIKLGLGKVERLLESLGNPERSFRSIHVAGTNGKGSVARMLAETLRRSRFRTGCTTSPHLLHFSERIEVDGQPIAEADAARLLAVIRPLVDALDAEGEPPTFFEIVTALAFAHFREAGVEWAVIETGMGGRLDATNVILPDVTIITNVSLDHTEHLGGTVGEIAWEKSGIMKRGVPCVTAAQDDALRVLKARSHEVQAPMSVVGEDYRIVPDSESLVLLRPRGESHYDVGLAGAHQLENAAIVVAAVEAARLRGVDIPERALRDALRETRHAGRLQRFEVPSARLGAGAAGTSVEILVDGAHNPAAAAALRAELVARGWDDFHLVVGFCRDKDWRAALAHWTPAAARVWAVPVRNPRALAPEVIVSQLSSPDAAAAPSVREAFSRAVQAGARRILVAGSLFLAGEAVALLMDERLEEIRGSQ
jgi:dihydrofolate synthase/folylpolyglutamate synthase